MALRSLDCLQCSPPLKIKAYVHLLAIVHIKSFYLHDSLHLNKYTLSWVDHPFKSGRAQRHNTIGLLCKE